VVRLLPNAAMLAAKRTGANMKKAHRKGQQRLKRRKSELRRKRMAARKAGKV
jgi:hypothetical protein